MKKDPRVQKVADAIRSAREKLGWNQEDYAREIGLARNHYGRIERGEQNMTLTVLFHIAGTLGVPPADLLDAVTVDDCLAIPRPSGRRARPKAPLGKQ